MLYSFLKSLHLLGVVLLLGNAVVTLVWKMAADRSRNPVLIAFGQRLVTLTDWWFTVGGVSLLMVGGYGAAWVAGLDLLGVAWLIWGQVLLVLSGAIWILVLVPAQIRQSHQAACFAVDGRIPPRFWLDARRWVGWGLLSIAPLVIAIWLMSLKPA